jgi:hypothetical protein
MDKFIKVLGVFAFTVCCIFMLAFLFAFITRWAWSGSIVPIFHVQEITYWQAYWLNVLGGMVCKGTSSYNFKS